MKIVYMGTPDFSVGALEALIKAGHTIVKVVTQPDKPKGRGKDIQVSPVKACALEHGLEVYQPLKIRDPEAVNYMKSLDADIYVVAAFGQILPQEVLDIPKFGCVNIHASLLPKYRGAAPIQQAIIDGEKYTGVTIMQMNAGMDTGDILLQKKIEISEEETGGSLFDKLSILGAELIVEALPLIEAGTLIPVKQDEELSTKCGKITKEMGHINWNMAALDISNLVRGLNPWPSSFSRIEGKTLKIWKAWATESTKTGTPGIISHVDKDYFEVNTGRGKLVVTEVQLEGKKRMPVKDFLLGYKLEEGSKLE
ncbi:MAG: methionyl-tRNA formyltransferase [Butyrivibrio sp.]|nr:methionyl-tRNA formyltransferase [Butyrivibrio sp.]